MGHPVNGLPPPLPPPMVCVSEQEHDPVMPPPGHWQSTEYMLPSLQVSVIWISQAPPLLLPPLGPWLQMIPVGPEVSPTSPISGKPAASEPLDPASAPLELPSWLE